MVSDFLCSLYSSGLMMSMKLDESMAARSETVVCLLIKGWKFYTDCNSTYSVA